MIRRIYWGFLAFSANIPKSQNVVILKEGLNTKVDEVEAVWKESCEAFLLSVGCWEPVWIVGDV